MASFRVGSDVSRRYYRGYICEHSYENNCAHILSNAFILADYRDLLISSLITHRCSHGRPTRVRDMLRWFQSKQNGFYGARVKSNTGIWSSYQEKTGRSHVVVMDSNAWSHYGTGDFWDWNVQWNYRIL